MNALIVSLVCLLPAAGEPLTEPADESMNLETTGDAPSSRLRVWSARAGEQQIEAEFIKLKGSLVYLKKSDGRIATVPVDKLSEPDQKWLWENTTADGRFRWDAGYVPRRANSEPKHRTPKIVHRAQCRPLAATLTTDDPIRIAIFTSRAWYLPASGSEPETYRPIPDSEIPVERLDTLKSLKIFVHTPAGQRYCLRADVQDNRPDVPSGHRLCTTLFLTITEDGLSEAEHVRGKWTSGKIAGFHELGWFSIRIVGSLVPLGQEDATLPVGSEFFSIKRVADGRKTLAEIEVIARAKVARLCGVAHPRGFPGRGVPTAVTELENGNRQAIYGVSSYRYLGTDWNTVELTPQGEPIRVSVWGSHVVRAEEKFRRLFHPCSDAETVWPKRHHDD